MWRALPQVALGLHRGGMDALLVPPAQQLEVGLQDRARLQHHLDVSRASFFFGFMRMFYVFPCFCSLALRPESRPQTRLEARLGPRGGPSDSAFC